VRVNVCTATAAKCTPGLRTTRMSFAAVYNSCATPHSRGCCSTGIMPKAAGLRKGCFGPGGRCRFCSCTCKDQEGTAGSAAATAVCSAGARGESNQPALQKPDALSDNDKASLSLSYATQILSCSNTGSTRMPMFRQRLRRVRRSSYKGLLASTWSVQLRLHLTVVALLAC
jgi:hypothetical protein